MKTLVSVLICFCFQTSFAQKLDIISLEKLLNSPVRSADSLLRNNKFNLSDKETGKGYINYYYTSYERKELFKHLLRSLSYMDIYGDKDTSRIVLYRTYYESDQQELKQQLLSNGYELTRQTDNNFVYKKGDLTITNKISEKKAARGKSMTAYEFELGR